MAINLDQTVDVIFYYVGLKTQIDTVFIGNFK